jgi:hypothetical protein
VAFDGEGWEGKYTLLACSAYPHDLYDPNGLSTIICLLYICNPELPRGAAYVGYGLSYDFENILKDVSDADYMKLRDGDAVEFEEYTLKYIPGKMLTISVPLGFKNKQGKPVIKTVVLQDVLSFFQDTFINALRKWDIDIPPEIIEGKQKRGNFGPEDIEAIKKYNRMELDLLVELMNRLRAADKQAFDLVGLKPNHSPRTWYGPGARARNFLLQTAWKDEHPQFSGAAYDELCSLIPENGGIHPFAAAYYGGRIESAGLGYIHAPMFDYDINSAYPLAITRLPKWGPDSLERVDGLDPQHRIGMYYVQWDIREQVNFCPLPFRSRSGNVFFPPAGRGWYMSPEVAAALEVYGPEQIQVARGYVLRGTEGAGDGLADLPPDVQSTTARYMQLLAAHRLQAKAEKMPAEKVLKLVMNSVYGKLIQQVGSHQFLSFLAGAWITSLCRAKIVRAVGKDTDGHIISIMTDGVLSLQPLNVPLSKTLGECELTPFSEGIQLLPGMYWLRDKREIPPACWEYPRDYESMTVLDWLEARAAKVVKRFRGVSKDFNPFTALSTCYEGQAPMLIKVRCFVTRSLALHQKNVFGRKTFEFVDLEKVEKFELGSKRLKRGGSYKLTPGESYATFPPKECKPEEYILGSTPYKIQEKPAEKLYDEAGNLETLADDEHLDSMLQQEYAWQGQLIEMDLHKQARKQIMSLGGVWDPDYELIPRWCKRKKGKGFDVLVGEVNELGGYNFETANELFEFVCTISPKR